MDHDTAVVWFRDDLRVHDNEALSEAARADRVVGVYCFDPREFGRREYGGPNSFEFRKTGAHRARFLAESVADLRDSMRSEGSELLVRRGHPEAVVPSVAEAVGADAVHYHAHPGVEERDVEAALKKRLGETEAVPQRYWGHTLYHVRDLPTPAARIPDTFTPFRKEVEAEATVREPIDAPELPPAPEEVAGGDVDPGSVPRIPDLDPDLASPEADDRAVLPFEGGEERGLERLEEYVWTRDRLRQYKETRNGLLGADYSSKLSPWLNRGCLSPRRVYAEIQAYERERVSNDSTYWLGFELLWRDFFQFQFEKYGATHFRRAGIRERTDLRWREDEAAFRRWADAETGIPFVDANQRELLATGFVSNRGRQNVASFLANDLGIDWRWGAAFYETHLVDYDPCSNYGNWAYVAGVGNDSRDRAFDVLAQARRYDPDADYVRRWLPELAELPPELAHAPWQASASELSAYGVDYPDPMVDPESLGDPR